MRDITYLGYRTKLSLILGAALIAGWTMTAIYVAIMGGLEGVLSPVLQKYLQGETPQHPPWRNKNWRALAITYLGSAAPKDLDLISDEVLNIWIEAARLIPDPMQQAQEISRVTREQTEAKMVDSYWQSWWDTLHHDVLLFRDSAAQMTLTLEANLQAASLLLLFAIPSTPVLNHWWVISTCLFWLIMRGLRTYALLRNVRNPWSSFTKQMDYLRARMPDAKAKARADDIQGNAG
jgi:hypothetical protein